MKIFILISLPFLCFAVVWVHGWWKGRKKDINQMLERVKRDE